MERGPLSLIYGDFDVDAYPVNPQEFVGFSLAGPLRLKLPNGSDLTIGDHHYIYISSDALGQALDYSVKQTRTLRRTMNYQPGRYITNEQVREQGYEMPDADLPVVGEGWVDMSAVVGAELVETDDEIPF